MSVFKLFWVGYFFGHFLGVGFGHQVTLDIGVLTGQALRSILENITEYYRILQNITQYYTILHNITEYYAIVRNTSVDRADS